MEFVAGLLALTWRLAMFVCLIVLISVSVALWNASQSEDRALARSAPSVVSWVLLSLTAAVAWAFLVALLVGFGGGYTGILGVVVLSLLLVGPAIYIRIGYRCIQKVKGESQES